MKPVMSMYAKREDYEKALEAWLDNQAGDPDDFYDADGNISESGIYDVGGHLSGERFAEFADMSDFTRD